MRRVPPKTFRRLKNAVLPEMVKITQESGLPLSERDCWDALWQSHFDIKQLYDAGLVDETIYNALRRIAQNA